MVLPCLGSKIMGMTKLLLTKRHRLHGLTLFYVVIVVAIIAAANSGVLPVRFIRYIPGGDKTGHFFFMGMLTFLICLSLGSLEWRRFTVPRACLGLWIVVGLEELSQMGLSRRSFDLTDLAADTVGIVVFGVLAALVLDRIRTRKHLIPTA